MVFISDKYYRVTSGVYLRLTFTGTHSRTYDLVTLYTSLIYHNYRELKNAVCLSENHIYSNRYHGVYSFQAAGGKRRLLEGGVYSSIM